MVFDFFKKSDTGIETILREVIDMLSDARHSFDLATDAILTGIDPQSVAEDIRETDLRINAAEQHLRSQLVVHVSVQGGGDIATVLGYILLIKKIERIGDQAKNILDLAEEGVSFAGAADQAELMQMRRTVSDLFGRVSRVLAAPVTADTDEGFAYVDDLRRECETRVREYLHSELPGNQVVPRAIFYRYLKRIVANLGGVITSATEPLTTQDYRDGGATDITDD